MQMVCIWYAAYHTMGYRDSDFKNSDWGSQIQYPRVSKQLWIITSWFIQGDVFLQNPNPQGLEKTWDELLKTSHAPSPANWNWGGGDLCADALDLDYHSSSHSSSISQ